MKEENRRNEPGVSPLRRRLLFQNAFSARNSKRALHIRVSLGLWFVLCASLSALLFTWTVVTTLDQNGILEQGGAGGPHNPFHRVTMSRDMLKRSEPLPQKHLSKLKELLKRSPHDDTPLDDEIPHDSSASASTSTSDENEDAIKGLNDDGSKHHLRSPPKIEGTHSLDPVPVHLQIPEDEKVVQVINTRFMQHQPHLLELGMARLELLKTLCLPTLVQQTSQNFLWVIRADPELHETIKHSLLDMIQNATEHSNLHVVVIGSNDNPSGFRRDITDRPEEVWTNNYALLEHVHQAAQSRIVLETRLDADDGLHNYFVEIMQEDAVQYLGIPKKNWLVWCAGTHVEWQYGTPWEDFPSPEANTTQNPSAVQVGDSSFGSLLPGLTRGCITPGLTKGYGKDVAFEEVPEAQHHMLHWQMKQCNNEHTNWEHCLVIWKRLVPTAIRGRTPTSAGMQFVLGKHFSHLSDESIQALGLQENNMLDKQGMMWDSVTRRFQITKESVASMREYLTSHMHQIAADNLEGQCTKGHSCKNSSQSILQQLVEETVQDGNSTHSEV